MTYLKIFLKNASMICFLDFVISKNFESPCIFLNRFLKSNLCYSILMIIEWYHLFMVLISLNSCHLPFSAIDFHSGVFIFFLVIRPSYRRITQWSGAGSSLVGSVTASNQRQCPGTLDGRERRFPMISATTWRARTCCQRPTAAQKVAHVPSVVAPSQKFRNPQNGAELERAISIQPLVGHGPHQGIVESIFKKMRNLVFFIPGHRSKISSDFYWKKTRENAKIPALFPPFPCSLFAACWRLH